MDGIYEKLATQAPIIVLFLLFLGVAGRAILKHMHDSRQQDAEDREKTSKTFERMSKEHRSDLKVMIDDYRGESTLNREQSEKISETIGGLNTTILGLKLMNNLHDEHGPGAGGS